MVDLAPRHEGVAATAWGTITPRPLGLSGASLATSASRDNSRVGPRPEQEAHSRAVSSGYHANYFAARAVSYRLTASDKNPARSSHRCSDPRHGPLVPSGREAGGQRAPPRLVCLLTQQSRRRLLRDWLVPAPAGATIPQTLESLGRTCDRSGMDVQQCAPRAADSAPPVAATYPNRPARLSTTSGRSVWRWCGPWPGTTGHAARLCCGVAAVPARTSMS